jgi:predicted RNA-binding Zn-ribbon protein involved in translation (DUF1610 family)
MTPVEATSQYSQICPACGKTINPSEIPVRIRNGFPCPSCGEFLMYDTSRFAAIAAASFLVAIFGAWRLGYRDTTFVLVVVTGTVLLWFFGIFLFGILIPPRLKRFKRIVWFSYHGRYSPAIWAASFALGNVVAFSLGYYGSLDHYAMFIFVVACITYPLGFLGNFFLGMLIPRPPSEAKGESFTSAGSLHLTDKSETDKKSDP